MTDISISIVTHNSAKVIGCLLESLFTYAKSQSIQVYVVDNGSTDNTVSIIKEQFPQVMLVEQENKGFGAGHNAILGSIDSKYHAIINPDIYFENDALDVLFTYMENHPEVAICNPQIHNPDGTRQLVPCIQPKYRYQLSRKLEKLGGIFRRWRDEYTMRNVAFVDPVDVGTCTGCFMFIRTELFKKLHGFDDRFFLYCEDADLSRRAQQYGKSVCVCPAVVVHGWERGSGHSLKLLRIHLSSMHKYKKKWRKEKV